MKSPILTCAACSIGLLTLFAVLPAQAADLAYAGRLVDAAGAPVAGPVEIILRFYGSATGSDQLGPSKSFAAVPLTDGVFQLTVSLEAADEAAIFQDGTALVYVEIEAASRRYPRQRFTHVPLALRIPVDNDALVYGADAKLTVGEIAIGQVQGLQAALAQKLDSTPASASASGYLSSADWTAFSAKQDAITASSSLTAGSISTKEQDAIVIKPYGAQAGETGELRFEEKVGGNYVGFKAPDTLAADKVWTLPAADGAAGEVLATDGSGGLSWVALSGANILDATISDAKLQTIATPGKVSGAAITSGTIGGSTAFAGSGGVTLSPAGSTATELRFQDDDASNYVAFKAPGTVASNVLFTLPTADGSNGQFLKTNGAGTLAWGSPAGSGDMLASANLNDLADIPTARSNLGLGALATVNAVGSGEITDGSIVNADVSGTAAIATSKLSGALTSISGHGLGSLATASSVTSAEITDSTIVNADVSGSAAIATSKLSGSVTSIAGHGLGALASLSSITSAEIGDGAIADADISGTAAIATSKLSGAVTSISGHGLGALAALSSVSTSEITNGTIADADISGTAAIATSKISGALTAISGHGLGALATASSVTSAEITDATIVDADVSGTAAIATSKMSGAVTAIAGHGLGSLATASSVGSAEIGDGSIVDADISGSAAVATSKLSGALTAVSGHGLGALATLSAVSTTEITNGTIANADISETAAIDSSKIANGSVSSTEFQYLDGLTSSVQTQLDAKASAASPTFTGAISSALGSAAAPSYSFSGDSNTGVWSSGADTVNISTAGSERLTVTSTGNVGIGTTTPGYPLQVYRTANSYVSVDTNSGGSTNLLLNSDTYSGISAATKLGLWTAGSERVRIETNGAVGIGTTTPAGLLDVNGKLTVLSGGNVGIGTTAPQTRLDVNGEIGSVGVNKGFRVSSTSGDNINSAPWWGLGYNSLGHTQVAGSDGIDFVTGGMGLNVGADQVIMSVTDTVAVKVDMSVAGNVGIGTTSPSAKLQVSGGQIVASSYDVASNAIVDFNNGNVQTLSAPGGSAITLNNMVDGGAYTLIVTDTTSRTYTFTNCTNSHFTPANAATTSGKHTIYTILKISIAAATHCYISWISDL